MLSVAGTVLDKYIKHKQTQADLSQASHRTSQGLDTGQRSHQTSSSPSKLYAKVDKDKKSKDDGVPDDFPALGQSSGVNGGRQSKTEEGNLYSTMDDAAGLRERDDGRGQMSSEDEEHLFTNAGDYGTMGQTSGTASGGQKGKREVSVASRTRGEVYKYNPPPPLDLIFFFFFFFFRGGGGVWG